MQLLANAATGLFPLSHMHERRRTSICASQTGIAGPAFADSQPFLNWTVDVLFLL
jgi:hypothetical protein